MARVSNTQSPCLSVQWIYAAKAAHFHVSLNTIKQGLFRSSSSLNRPVFDEFGKIKPVYDCHMPYEYFITTVVN